MDHLRNSDPETRPKNAHSAPDTCGIQSQPQSGWVHVDSATIVSLIDCAVRASKATDGHIIGTPLRDGISRVYTAHRYYLLALRMLPVHLQPSLQSPHPERLNGQSHTSYYSCETA